MNISLRYSTVTIYCFFAWSEWPSTKSIYSVKYSWRWTWHSSDGKDHNQIDYILVRKRLRWGVNIPRTRSFHGADIGSDHDLVMMTFRVRLKKARKPAQQTVKFDLEKQRDPVLASTFQTTAGGKFAPHQSDGWRYGHRYHDYHLQWSSDWHSQWGTWRGTSKEKALGYQRYSWRPLEDILNMSDTY